MPNAIVSRMRAASVVCFLILAAPFIIGGPSLIVRYYSVDDTFYYLQIARNLADGHGSTFDGRSTTNGYQLLWQGVLVPLASVFHGRDALLEATIILSCALIAGGAYVLARLCGGLCDDDRTRSLVALVVLGIVVVLALKSATGLLTGMEAALTFFVLALFARALFILDVKPKATARATALCCTFAVLLVLCRQDYVVVAGSLVLSLFVLRFVERRREPFTVVLREEGARWLPVLSAVVLGLLVSFALYLAIDGTAVPVSGLVKLRRGVPRRLSGLPQRFVNALFPFAFSSRSVVNLLGAIAIVAIAVFLIWNRYNLRAPRLARALVSAGFTFAIYCSFMSFSLGDAAAWYLAIAVYFYTVFAAVAVVEINAVLARSRGSDRVSNYVLGLGLGALVFISALSAAFLPASDAAALYSARRDFGRSLGKSPSACRFAALNAGQLGYYSGDRVVDLDGLVNSNNYRLHVLGDSARLEDYLREKGINRLVDYDFSWATPILAGYTPVASVPIRGDRTLRVFAPKATKDDACHA